MKKYYLISYSKDLYSHENLTTEVGWYYESDAHTAQHLAYYKERLKRYYSLVSINEVVVSDVGLIESTKNIMYEKVPLKQLVELNTKAKKSVNKAFTKMPKSIAGNYNVEGIEALIANIHNE